MVEVEEKKLYQAFYTNSIPIVRRMVDNLNIQVDDLIFEPCGGSGVFIDEILNNQENPSIEINELNFDAFLLLKEKYTGFPTIKINHTDTLLDSKFSLVGFQDGHFDKIIANPPYGAWQDYSKRSDLKKLFKDFYIKETYTLFLYLCVKLLKDKGLLSFIIPDTYLNLHMHKRMRKFLLESTKIKEILLFPSSFFPGVNFGYANLSIITLEKCSRVDESLSNKVTIITNFKKVDDLLNVNQDFLEKHEITQLSILNNSDHAFLINYNPKVLSIISEVKLIVGDIADCVTGFYSGNDKAFVKVKNKEVKNSKNYLTVENKEIHIQDDTPISLNGIVNDKHFIPIVKGGNTRYLKDDNWFIDWSANSVRHYKINKKSRFQNSKFYFKRGIGVPMVSSSRITASLIDSKMFDQSIVGIFPKDERYLYYLLGFFNSNTCNLLIRTINPSANNPSNYIKKIPFIVPNQEQLDIVTNLVSKIMESLRLSNSYPKDLDIELDKAFSIIYGI